MLAQATAVASSDKRMLACRFLYSEAGASTSKPSNGGPGGGPPDLSIAASSSRARTTSSAVRANDVLRRYTCRRLAKGAGFHILRKFSNFAILHNDINRHLRSTKRRAFHGAGVWIVQTSHMRHLRCEGENACGIKFDQLNLFSHCLDIPRCTQ